MWTLFIILGSKGFLLGGKSEINNYMSYEIWNQQMLMKFLISKVFYKFSFQNIERNDLNSFIY